MAKNYVNNRMTAVRALRLIRGETDAHVKNEMLEAYQMAVDDPSIWSRLRPPERNTAKALAWSHLITAPSRWKHVGTFEPYGLLREMRF